MKYILVPFRILYCLYAVIIFVALMLLVIPFVIVGSFFGKIQGGNFIFRLCMLWGDCWFFLIGIRHKNIYASPHNKTEQYIFVANHISYLDAAIIVKVMRQPIRILGKVELSKVPIFGFIYRNAIVTVDRSSAENRAKSVRILKSVLSKGISIFIFPEGTFNMGHQPLKDFYDGAFKIALESQTPIKPILFLDTFDRMHYRSIFSLTPGKSRAVFLEEIPVDGLTIKDTELLKKRVYDVMDARLREFNVPWIKA